MRCSVDEPEEAGSIRVERVRQIAEMADSSLVPTPKVRAKHQPVGSDLFHGKRELGITGDMTIEPKTIKGSVAIHIQRFQDVQSSYAAH